VSSGILIMARAPRPGGVKTRLEPLLGHDGCARLQAELIRHTTGWAASAAPRTWLAFTPARTRDEVAPLVPGRVSLFPQASGDLGARLQEAVCRIGREHADRLIVIGTDVPLLGREHVAAAERELGDGHDACLVPALDGGYALIALARATPAAFQIHPTAWGGPHVLELTIDALDRAGLETATLEPVRDLDTPADARALLREPGCPPALHAVLSPDQTGAS